MNNIEKQIKEITAKQLCKNVDEVKNTDNFVEDLGTDSLDTLMLVVTFEKEFGINISDSDVDKMLTVQLAVDYVSRKVDGKQISQPRLAA